MNRLTRTSTQIACLAAATIALAGQAQAAPPSTAQLRYQQERADCMSGASHQDRATCLREASAALKEARRGNLSAGDPAQNSTARCDALPEGDRQDCVSRMRTGSASGSVREGGILRESTQPVAPK